MAVRVGIPRILQSEMWYVSFNLLDLTLSTASLASMEYLGRQRSPVAELRHHGRSLREVSHIYHCCPQLVHASQRVRHAFDSRYTYGRSLDARRQSREASLFQL